MACGSVVPQVNSGSRAQIATKGSNTATVITGQSMKCSNGMLVQLQCSTPAVATECKVQSRSREHLLLPPCSYSIAAA